MSKSKKADRPPPLQLPLRTIATSNTIQSLYFREKGKMNSPMTNLAMNLSELSTGRGTPRRKLSLSSLDTPPASAFHPTPERLSSTESSESGCFVDSPTPLDSPTLESLSMQRYAKTVQPEIPPEAYTKKKTIAFRRIQSMPLPMMRLSPVDFLDKENEESVSPPPLCNFELDIAERQDVAVKPRFFLDENSSQDSGVGMADREDESHDEFPFVAPKGVPPRNNKLKIISEDTCSPLKYSPVKTSDSTDSPFRPRSNSAPVTGLDFSSAHISPVTLEESDSPLKTCPLVSLDDEDEGVDDGFLDMIDQEVAHINNETPTSMSRLFSAPVLNTSEVTETDNETPVIRRTQSRLLQRSQSFFDSRSSRTSSFKRDRDENTPVQSKRRRSLLQSDADDYVCSKKTPPRPKLHRCHSESEAVIKSALNRIADEPDLIGDFSRSYCLPTVQGKHSDLKGISPATVSKILNDEYSHVIEQAIVIDCRYPYEYEGGHIKGARNIYTKEDIIKEFLKKPKAPHSSEKRNILIFHCEFSSERGPNLCRFLRKHDRETNKDCYPALYYPELYILEGGYKVFYENHKEHCVPQSYKPMLHRDHSSDLKHFRLKSKSWAGEKSNRPGFRPLKF